MLGRRLVLSPVDGSPFQPGAIVKIIEICDDVGHDVGLQDRVGQFGVVKYLEYSCGCGQHYPDDPMIGVRFKDNMVCEFWKEEIVHAALQTTL